MRQPTYYLSHGGGPWPYMQGEFRSRFDLMEAALTDIPNQLPAYPKAVLVISGHWEEASFTVGSSARPGMVYDYGGFPEETYHVVYPAPGSPDLARRVHALLQDAGWPAQLDGERGFDHGTFSMLKPMYPQADIPVVQLSLKRSLDAAEHLRMGRALAPMRDEGVLIVGSGMSYHNLRLFSAAGTAHSVAFDGWLRRTLTMREPEERFEALAQWQQAPSARVAHPRSDHLLPLMVALGAAGGDPATCVFGQLFSGQIHVSSFRFGADVTPTRFDLLGTHATRTIGENARSAT